MESCQSEVDVVPFWLQVPEFKMTLSGTFIAFVLDLQAVLV